jgi:hypothetical protein
MARPDLKPLISSIPTSDWTDLEITVSGRGIQCDYCKLLIEAGSPHTRGERCMKARLMLPSKSGGLFDAKPRVHHKCLQIAYRSAR